MKLKKYATYRLEQQNQDLKKTYPYHNVIFLKIDFFSIFYSYVDIYINFAFCSKKTPLWHLFMNGVQLPQSIEPLCWGILLVTIKFQESPGTHLIDLRRMKSTLEHPQDPWIGNPVPQPLGHCSINLGKIHLYIYQLNGSIDNPAFQWRQE